MGSMLDIFGFFWGDCTSATFILGINYREAHLWGSIGGGNHTAECPLQLPSLSPREEPTRLCSSPLPYPFPFSLPHPHHSCFHHGIMLLPNLYLIK